MRESWLKLSAAPIIEAVVDIDCDMPPSTDLEALGKAAHLLLIEQYPTARKRMVSQHEFSAGPGAPVPVASRQAVQAIQFVSGDEKQLVQFRPGGFSFNRLAPYTSLDDYLPEIERNWALFVQMAQPALCRALRMRFINRFLLPTTEDGIAIDKYLRFVPPPADVERLTLAGFFNQHTVLEEATGNQANVLFATQDFENDRLPIIFDIEAIKVADCDPGDWITISGRIAELRDLKNLIFQKSLTDKCLELFQQP